MSEQPINSITNPDDFLRGQESCQTGLPSPLNETEDFERGYAAQYAQEQMLTERSEQ
ncbi:hypothetical protein [Microbulbifer sp. TYP-18]|uniref:hypothetical protein n=1 Tax=Microbulbifer sp. TYP-18 TaxID=3230024 RepID=UPI0034C69341